jgi:hypothetical protein
MPWEGADESPILKKLILLLLAKIEYQGVELNHLAK